MGRFYMSHETRVDYMMEEYKSEYTYFTDLDMLPVDEEIHEINYSGDVDFSAGMLNLPIDFMRGDMLRPYLRSIYQKEIITG